jgi:WD40 repeat protein
MAFAVARLVELQGQIELHSPSGELEAIAVGVEIQAGQSVRTSSGDSFAVLELPDRTRLELSADTQIRLGEDSAGGTGRRLVLSSGLLHAEVQPQPRNRPLVVVTPQAEIEVRGTRFTVSAISPIATEVATETGMVQLKRLADGSCVDVPAGSFALAGAGFQPMATSPVQQLAAEPRWRFDLVDAASLSFSPDGSKLLAVSGRKYALWDVRTGEALVSPTRYNTDGVILMGSQDARTFVYRYKDGRVCLWNTETCQSRTLAETGLSLGWVFAASSDGSKVAAGSTARSLGTIRRWRTAEGRESAPWTAPSRVSWLAFAPDGQRLAAGLGVAEQERKRVVHIAILEPAGGEPTMLPLPGPAEIRAMAFSADGQRLAVATDRGEVYLWDLPSKTLLAARDATDGWSWPIKSLAFSSNGRILAAGGVRGRLRLWDTVTHRELLFRPVGNSAIQTVAFSPDRRFIAACMLQENSVTLWDVPEELPGP